MKRCTTCNRTYTDPNLSYCIDDGTPLTPVEDETTVVSPRASQTENSQTENSWNAAPYRPPGAYVPPGAPVRRRRAWPWILGILGAFILGVVVISIAAAILAPRLLRARQNEQANRAVENSNTSEPANSNSDNSNGSNVNSNEDVNTPPPTDKDQVKTQLRDLEHDWTVANINADKKALDRILADDFVAPSGEDGQLQTKADYIRTIERDTTIRKWDFDDLKVALAGDRATLTGKITFEVGDRDQEYDFIDKFVWRDGRWQATGSQVTRRD
jgi:type II secretory pathway pseudopilin PulG